MGTTLSKESTNRSPKPLHPLSIDSEHEESAWRKMSALAYAEHSPLPGWMAPPVGLSAHDPTEKNELLVRRV